MQTRSSVRAVADKNVKRTYHPKLRGRSRLKDIYDMSAPIRGYCLIFANSCFDHRSGLGVLKEYTFDSERLETVFKQLSFEVHVFRNSTGLDILAQITSYSQDVDVNQNAFVVIILTHGTAKHLLGSDFVGYNETPDAVITEKQILEIVSNRSCPGLVGKPKMFFIQACRGEQEDQGVDLDGSALWNGSTNEADLDRVAAIGACVQVPGNLPGEGEGQDEEYARQRHESVAGSLPTRTDVMVCYSTLLDYRSFVGTHGSVFGQELAKALILHAYNTDLQHIINKMSKSMADIETLSRMGNKAVNVKQAISVRYDGWTCKLYFNPGYPKLKSPVRDVISEHANQYENHECDTDTPIIPTNDSVVPPSSNSNDQGQHVRKSRKRARSGAKTNLKTGTVKARVTRSQDSTESSAKGTRSSPGKRTGTQEKGVNRDQRTLDNFLSFKPKTRASQDPHTDAGDLSLSGINSTEAAPALAPIVKANEIHPNPRLKNSYIRDYFSPEATAGPSNGREAVPGALPPGTTENGNKRELAPKIS